MAGMCCISIIVLSLLGIANATGGGANGHVVTEISPMKIDAVVNTESATLHSVHVVPEASIVTVTITEAATFCVTSSSSVLIDTSQHATPSVTLVSPLVTTPNTVPGNASSLITATGFASTAVVPAPPPTATGVSGNGTVATSVTSEVTPANNPTPSLTTGTPPPASPTAASDGDFLGVDMTTLMELMGASVFCMFI